jgi:tRNA A37 threonylcarbamoyladenosine modification protein TsaB
MYLYINTTNHKKVEVSIIKNNEQKIDSINFSCQYQFEIKDKLLKSIDKILAKNKIPKRNLTKIIAVNKSKEMASLRIGISTANALAYSLNIPACPVGTEHCSVHTPQIKKFRPIKPKYEINPMLKK